MIYDMVNMLSFPLEYLLLQSTWWGRLFESASKGICLLDKLIERIYIVQLYALQISILGMCHFLMYGCAFAGIGNAALINSNLWELLFIDMLLAFLNTCAEYHVKVISQLSAIHTIHSILCFSRVAYRSTSSATRKISMKATLIVYHLPFKTAIINKAYVMNDWWGCEKAAYALLLKI